MGVTLEVKEMKLVLKKMSEVLEELAEGLEILNNQHLTLFEAVHRQDTILETIKPGCIGEWEEEHCEGGGKAPE